MAFLIDTNVVIAAEPFDGLIEDAHAAVSAFLRLATEHGHRIYVHPATKDDLGENGNDARRAQKLAAYDKYAQLNEVPVPREVVDVFPSPLKTNDSRDARILGALHIGAVHFLVTEDTRLRRRAARLGHDTKVLTPGEAATQLAAWHPKSPLPPPSVTAVATYELDPTQRIFDGLRTDYHPHFDSWMAKVKADFAGRRAWVVQTPDGTYEALAIVKMRDAHPVTPGADAIKLSTFKVADSAAGRRLGELMLKAVLRWAAHEPGRPSEIFVEVDAAKTRMIDFLGEFGFAFATVKPGTADEHIYLKRLDPSAGSILNGLEHHIAHGPPAVLQGQPVFVVPITPRWFFDLFPDATVLDGLGAAVLPETFASSKPHGNAIRKAYLCRSPTRHIPAGSTLLFYRSRSRSQRHGEGAVVAVGVAEQARSSLDPRETIELSFKRTVYSAEEVAELHQDGGAVLTILFRHDRFLIPPWTLRELQSNRVISSWPQSIVRVKDKEGLAWVEDRLGA